MKKSNPPDTTKSNRIWSERSAEYMSEALELARRAAEQDEVPVGAVVIDSLGSVVGRGGNRREQDHNPCSHAEIEAILSAARDRGDWRLEDCALFVTLEPCPMCLAACQQARLVEVVYGAVDPKGGALSLGYKLHEDTRLNHRFVVRLEERAECGQVLREFFAKKRG